MGILEQLHGLEILLHACNRTAYLFLAIQSASCGFITLATWADVSTACSGDTTLGNCANSMGQLLRLEILLRGYIINVFSVMDVWALHLQATVQHASCEFIALDACAAWATSYVEFTL